MDNELKEIKEKSDKPLFMPAGSVRALIALGLLTTIGILLVIGKPVPQELWVLTTAVVTYYFSNK